MALGGLFGDVRTTGWPAQWDSQICRVFHPPLDGKIDDLYVGSDIVEFQVHDRSSAIHLLAPHWQNYLHIGEVPGEEEIKTANGQLS